MNKSNRDPLQGLGAPRVPADLERRVLDAARNAEQGVANATVWDRLWESRTIRRAWVSATLGLLLAHAGMSLFSDSPQSADELRSVDRRQARELRETLALPVVEISPRAEAIALGARRPSATRRRSDASRPTDRS